MIKCIKSLKEYQYILSFDLAKKITGYSLLDIQNNKVVLAGMINTAECKDDFVWDYYYNQILAVLDHCLIEIGRENEDLLFVTKERLPNQNGKFSTIDTLQSLAQVHAIFDLAVYHKGLEVYDYEGIHSVSVKAYFKSLLNIDKPQKEDIAEHIRKVYKDFDFSEYSLDVTDSLAVSMTLIGKKYNNDIAEEVKILKKELKNTKSNNKIEKIKNKIILLEGLKYDNNK